MTSRRGFSFIGRIYAYYCSVRCIRKIYQGNLLCCVCVCSEMHQYSRGVLVGSTPNSSDHHAVAHLFKPLQMVPARKGRQKMVSFEASAFQKRSIHTQISIDT